MQKDFVENKVSLLSIALTCHAHRYFAKLSTRRRSNFIYKKAKKALNMQDATITSVTQHWFFGKLKFLI